MSEACPICPKFNRCLPSLQYRARILAQYCKPRARKCRQIPSHAFYTKELIKCPTQYLPSLSCLCPHTLRQIIPQCSVTQGIYVNICLSLRSNRQSLSRRQGTILIKTANAVTLFSSRYTIDRKMGFFGEIGIFESDTRTGKKPEWHATAGNMGLAQAGHRLVGKCLQNSKLCSSWQECVSPACAKPWHVGCKCRATVRTNSV